MISQEPQQPPLLHTNPVQLLQHLHLHTVAATKLKLLYSGLSSCCSQKPQQPPLYSLSSYYSKELQQPPLLSCLYCSTLSQLINYCRNTNPTVQQPIYASWWTLGSDVVGLLISQEPQQPPLLNLLSCYIQEHQHSPLLCTNPAQ